MGTGYSGDNRSDMWKYSKNTNTWTQLQDMPGTARSYIASFVIKNKGYALGGWDGSKSYKDLYEYDPTNDTWKQKNVPTSFLARSSMINLVFGNVVFLGLGNESNYSYFNDLWKLNFGN